MADRGCSSCGAVLPAGARFCSSCGAGSSPRVDERRVVTVLFADVVGFTPLSERKDPEHIKNLLDRCFERLASDITMHGGRVDKIVGDEIMAVFGAPIAHEDDPERAVRAGLQMQRNLIEHAEETGADVRMRIGVNTGEVLVGNLRAGGDVTALGDVVNIAKRLQTAAEPGTVLVGPTTQDATKNVISYTELGALNIKGREGTVEAWQAVEALGAPGARPGRARTPVVGRKSEIALLWHALGTAVAHDRPHFVLLMGDAGMGKTVLVEEAIEMARVQHDALVLQGRCLPYGEANPWWPIAEALREACNIDPEDPADIAEDKCRRAIGAVIGTDDEGAEASRVSDGLLYLMGYGGKLNDIEPGRAREEAIRSVQLSLAANARIRPLVIILSEIHWADQLVLDLIDSMFDRLRNLPIVLIATARPELEERWAPRPGRHNIFIVNLDPLDRDETTDVMRKLLGIEPPPDLVELVCERSGGNPLFISELIAMVGEAGFGATPGDRYEFATLPATLRGLIAARLDGLDDDQRAILEDASVIGRSGQLEALVALGGARAETDPHPKIRMLAHKDLLVVQDGDFEFKSDLVRDVAYETLTKAERARRHAALAEWLSEYAKRTEREDEHIERIAHHYAKAAQLATEVGGNAVPADIVDRALTWLDRATARAEERETTAVSVHLLEHAFRLAGDDPARKAKLLLGRARGRLGLHDMDGAHSDIAHLLQLETKVDDPTLRPRALTLRGEVEQRQGALDTSAATLEEAVGLWRAVGDVRGEAEALRLWGYTSIHRGELDSAEQAISDALALSRQIKDRRGEAWALQNLAWGSFTRGDYGLAEERLIASSDLFRQIGDYGGQGWANGLLGWVWFFQGHLERAQTVAENGINWTREMGDRWAHGMMLNLLAGVRLWTGRTHESLDRSTEAYELFNEMNDDMGLSFSTVSRAWAMLFTGHAQDAIAIADALGQRENNALNTSIASIMSGANFRTLAGDGEGALSVFERAGITGTADDPDILNARALALFVAGRSDEAFAASSRAYTLGTDGALSADVGSRANTLCIFALTAAASGHPNEAIEAAEEVQRLGGGTYADHVRTRIAQSFAYAQLDQAELSAQCLEDARTLVEGTEDEFHKTLVLLAESTVATVKGSATAPNAEPINEVRDRLEALGVAWRPWEDVFRLCTTGGRTEPLVTQTGE